MPELATGTTRTTFFPFCPPSGAYFGFLRSVERLKGESNKSRFSRDFSSALAWRHQFKFLVTHDAQGQPLPHIGVATFAEFLNSKGNVLKLKAALFQTDEETAKQQNLPHSNDLIGLPFFLRFERMEGVNSGGRPFIQTNIDTLLGVNEQWRNYLYQWLHAIGFERAAIKESTDLYLAAPRAARACELSEAELKAYGFQNYAVLGAIAQQRATMLAQQTRTLTQGVSQQLPGETGRAPLHAVGAPALPPSPAAPAPAQAPPTVPGPTVQPPVAAVSVAPQAVDSARATPTREQALVEAREALRRAGIPDAQIDVMLAAASPAPSPVIAPPPAAVTQPPADQSAPIAPAAQPPSSAPPSQPAQTILRATPPSVPQQASPAVAEVQPGAHGALPDEGDAGEIDWNALESEIPM